MNRFESQRIEWKESWRDDLLCWISGFANAEGGRLEIGRLTQKGRALLEQLKKKGGRE